MPVVKSRQNAIRQFSMESILSLYDKNTHGPIPLQTKKTFQDIRKELQAVLKQTEQRNKKNERRRHHNHNSRSNGGSAGHRGTRDNRNNRDSRDSHNNIVITRSANTSVDAFKTFQKKYNLILNSLIDSNADDVCTRLSKLFLQQKAIVATEKGELDEKATQFASHVCQQMLNNASIQSIYSQVYVTVFQSLLDKVDAEGYHTLHAFLRKHVVDTVMQTKPETLNKLSAKGLAKFATYLYMGNVMCRETFQAFLQKWLDHLQVNEANICEVLVHVFLALADTKICLAQWKSYVETVVQPLWADTSTLSMRHRIRLWDIRDAYGLA